MTVVLRRSPWKSLCGNPVFAISVTFVQLALMLTTLGASILEPDLHSRLAKTESLAQLFPHERIGVMRLVEESLELGQLLDGEVRPGSPLLAVSVCVAPAIGSCKLTEVKIMFDIQKSSISV